MIVWRIAAESPSYTADDLTGRGAEQTGGRWNREGWPVVYASASIALACLETLVHLGDTLPLNRYLVEITIPDAAWDARAIFVPEDHVGWDAEPAGMTSLDWGTAWLRGGATALAEVPSVIVPEEKNILINPRHTDAVAITARKRRRFDYDRRFGS